MPTCECGAEIEAKNSAGHYRDKCWDCLTDSVTTTSHVDTCDRADCPVCNDWIQEFGE